MATVCITGPNRGIGLELARQFRARGDDVIAIVREPTPALIETGCEIVSGVDVTDAASTAILKDALQGRSIDLLLNNGGRLDDASLRPTGHQTRHRDRKTWLAPVANRRPDSGDLPPHRGTEQ